MNSKATRQARLASQTANQTPATDPVDEQQQTTESEAATPETAVEQPEATTDQATPETVAEQPAEKVAAKPKKQPKPVVDDLARVIQAQQSPTMWQYARLAKAVKARTESGQDEADAVAAVIEQARTIINGILALDPASSKDGPIDAATKAYFQAHHPGSLRERIKSE